jgi:cell wall-associated NlpC family hydrolase
VYTPRTLIKFSMATVALSMSAALGVAAPASAGGGTGPGGTSAVASLPKHHTPTLREREAAAVRYAYKHLGAHYVWGATGPRTFDCSGLAIAAWRYAGVHLTGRTTTQLLAHGHWVSRNHLAPGDLLFFYGVSHVGIYVGGGYMIHASSSKGQVVKTKLSYPGYSFWSYFSGAIRPGV